MRKFRASVVAGLALCALPMVSLAVAATVAHLAGRVLHEGSPTPCVVMGLNFGGVLYAMGVMGWLVLLTLPLSGSLLLLWTITEVVRLARRRGVAKG